MPVLRFLQPPPGLVRAVAGVVALALTGANPLHAQESSPLARIQGFDVERIEIGRATVLYSAGHDADEDLEANARRTAARFEEAAGFFAERLGGDFRYNLALLSPRHWSQVAGRHALPWSAEGDRLVVVPVRSDMSLLRQSGRDSAAAQPVVDVISYHQLGHVVLAAYLHPAGFRGQTPILWFDELLASYLGHWYMRENRPELADYEEELAWDVTRRTEPRFSSLPQYDEYHEGYLTSPLGANTLGWYQNAFNLWAAELYDDFGAEFFLRVRKELPWVRLETWTTESLLKELEDIAPGFRNWAREMAEASAPGYR